MTVSVAKPAKITGSCFRAIVWVVLLAFTLQSLITQTHIHNVFADAGGPVAKTLANGALHSKRPAQDSTNYCPFCQAITHAGVFSAPSAPCLIVPISLVDTAAPVFLAAVISIASSHPWHSRAPPGR